MAIRRFNYTGRKRLDQNDARIFAHQANNGGVEFDAELSLVGYELPDDALVSVEAYRQTSWMRFPCGTVGTLQIPPDRRLREFDSPEGVLFRVRVTSASHPAGLLLAEADRISPRLPEEVEENRISLLPVKPDDDLGDEIFRVDFTDKPILLINSRVGDWRSVAREPVFISLTFPTAMREILTRILHVERHFETQDTTDWKSQWLNFSIHLPGVPDLPSEDEEDNIDRWIEEAVASFCRRFGIYSRFAQYWTEEVSS